MPDKAVELRRDRELASRSNSALCKDLVKTFHEVMDGYQAQADRADDIMDYWDCYNCILGQDQFYNGNSEIYVPIVRNAINARRTRFVNQIFPSSGRYIDATSSDGSVPHAVVALLEHYVRSTKLRTNVMMPLCRNGDIEGQYNVYVDWDTTERHIAKKVLRGVKISEKLKGIDDSYEVPGEEIEDIEHETIVDAGPGVEVLHDADVLVWPPTATSIEAALRDGGHVSIVRRWTKAQIEEMADRKILMRKPAEELMETMARYEREGVRDTAKGLHEAAGVRESGKYAVAHETWKVLDVPGEGSRLVQSFYGGNDLILGAHRDPFWNDRCPLLSVPVEKVAGSFKGMSLVGPSVYSLQLHANDIANQAADSATYSMLPIVMTDPLKNPRTATMVLNLAAVWECDPNTTKFAQFPPLWKDGIALIQADTSMIFQTLGVNPAMMPQSTGRPGVKRNQAEIFLEQSVDVLTTAEACSVLEEGILTPLVGERFVEYDHQFRDEAMTVRAYGELGIAAKMEQVEPIQLGQRLNFVWFGVEQARTVQARQAQAQLLNVAMQPQMQQALQAGGYRINPVPALESAFMEQFGSRQGRQIIVDMRRELAVDPEIENDIMMQGMPMVVHPMDDFAAHMKSHLQAKMMTGDPTGEIQSHMQRHLMQQALQTKSRVMEGMQGQGGASGGGPPGGAAPQPGNRGTPPGAAPGQPRLVKGPPGVIHPDRMPLAMPRKT